MSKIIEKLLEDARKKLVETGTRNRLIHVNRANQRANALNIINERSEDIFKILRVDGKQMSFKATGKDTVEDQDDIQLAPPEDEIFDEARYQDSILETPLGPEALQRRLLRLFTAAKTAEEEQGVNILYLAMGFLKWYAPDSSDVLRESPLILLPVKLMRSRHGANLRCSDDDVATNLPLQRRFMDDFGIQLPEIDDSEEWRPTSYFEEIRAVIDGQPRWEVDEDGMQLGPFSFFKFLMWRDLHPDNWPETKLVSNELIQGLLEKGFSPEPPLFGNDEKLDTRLNPADIIQVVEADASQTRVIEEVRSGRNLVVQGPPGTGKSQTITNIIAAAVYDGKSVLFVAEKMAALEVVHRRLLGVDLGNICLELHSRKANKKAVLQELERTLSAGSSVPGQPKPPKELRASRDKLNQIADLLHDKVPECDYSPFSAMAKICDFIGREVPPPKLEVKDLHLLSNEECTRLRQKIADYVSVLERVGTLANHPFFGTRALDLQPPDLQRLGTELDQASGILAEILRATASLAKRLKQDAPDTLEDVKRMIPLLDLARDTPEGIEVVAPVFLEHRNDAALRDALTTGQAWRDAMDADADKFIEAAWTVPLDQTRARLFKGVHSFLSRVFGGYRGASRELESLLTISLPPKPSERLELIDRLLSIRHLRATLAGDRELLSTVLGNLWRGERTDFSALVHARDWVGALLNTVGDATLETVQAFLGIQPEVDEWKERLTRLRAEAPGAVGRVVSRLDLLLVSDEAETSGIPLEWLRTRFKRMRQEINCYDEWVTLSRNKQSLDSAGLAVLVKYLEKGRLPPAGAVDEFDYAVAEARWSHAINVLPELGELAQTKRDLLVRKFCDLDRKWITDARTLIKARHLGQLPRGAEGEIGYIQGEIKKKRNHKSIRKLVEKAGRTVGQIKPVFLMSPISVAQFLPPGAIEFDLLVIDEASQVRPEDALGAVARAKQIVVVGDQKQLPPTSFFERLSNDALDEDEDDEEVEGMIPGTAKATEMESILSLCEAKGLKPSMLEWHYRSRDPSLIRVSNEKFYNNRLILPPSPSQMDDNHGLKFTCVPGVYSSKSRGGGRPGTNWVEAQYITNALADHARNWPDLSIGVVAFSKTQSDMITEVLEVKRREDEALDTLLRGDKVEDVFVKNIENVQGDERDVILISVGYGPHEPKGRLASMNFGPVNGEGGERRLNVLFSRAKVRCEVFVSFDPGDMDLTRTRRAGPRVLKRFLEFAKTRRIDEDIITGLEADSPFEEDVARVIRHLGYLADHQVGSAGFRIDIGARHQDKPGAYILAVECDGAAWHRALLARERDRLRQDVLEGLGWRFHRIWSTDWFHRREAEIDKLKEALEAARTKMTTKIVVEGSNADQPATPAPPEIDDPSIEPKPLPSNIKVPPYRRAELQVTSAKEPHEVLPEEMADYVVQIVQCEGPVHSEEVARRVASAFGKQRIGLRIQEAVDKGLRKANHQGYLESEGRFWLTPEQRMNTPVRNRSGETLPTTKADHLSSLEIRAAAQMIEAESGNVEREKMIRAVAKLLGYHRVGRDLNEVIAQALSS